MINMGLPLIRVYTNFLKTSQSSVVEANLIGEGLLLFADPIPCSIRKHGKESYFHAQYIDRALNGFNQFYHGMIDGSQRNFEIQTNGHNSNFKIENVFSGENNIKISAMGDGYKIDLIADTCISHHTESVAGALVATAIISSEISANDDLFSKQQMEPKAISGLVSSGSLEAGVVVTPIGNYPLTLPDNNDCEDSPTIAYLITGASRTIQ